MNVLLLRWDTKPDKRIRRTFLRPASTRRTSFYAAERAFAAELRKTPDSADESAAAVGACRNGKWACDGAGRT
jgi:hypothetical protein